MVWISRTAITIGAMLDAGRSARRIVPESHCVFPNDASQTSRMRSNRAGMLSAMRLQPFTLTGSFVQLEPLAETMVADLVDAGNRDRSTYRYTAVPSTVAAMHDYITGLLGDAEADTVVPFAQRRVGDQRLVGCTRFLNVLWWAGRDTPAEVEIGGTWLAADAQRSAINTEAKLLLMSHAFEVWHVPRVAICTDADNERSRRAIERLGATLEGVLRNHRMVSGDDAPPGSARNSAMYSVIDSEWPAVKQRLTALLEVRS
jgi:N-acetyltransferase